MGRQEQETALYDQPESSKKPKRARYAPTPAQVIMRHEMTTLGDVFDEVVGVETSPEAELSADGQIEAQIKDIAIEIIEYGPKLQLSLREWHIVQSLIETGIKRGVLVGKNGSAPVWP